MVLRRAESSTLLPLPRSRTDGDRRQSSPGLVRRTEVRGSDSVSRPSRTWTMSSRRWSRCGASHPGWRPGARSWRAGWRAGQRLLAAGNGGSAAEAQHLTAELVGRFDGERVPFSAISLHAETSAVTAIANDYGFEELFARQVRAHGRSGDILLLLSTSGKSPNLLRAVETAARLDVTTWALTGTGPNPLALSCDEAVTIDSPAANAQECHLIALHAICRAFDAEILRQGPLESVARGRVMNIVVVGDVLLDVDVDGKATRLCPDAPVPVVDVSGARYRAGGAGLVATNARRGRAPRGSCDSTRRRRRRLPGSSGSLTGVTVVAGPSGAPTPVKTRVRAERPPGGPVR